MNLLSVRCFHQMVKEVNTINKAYKCYKNHEVLGYIAHQLGAEQPLAPHIEKKMGVAIPAVYFFGPQNMGCDAVSMDFFPVTVTNSDQF